MNKRPPFSWLIVCVCIVGFLFRFDFYGLSVALPSIAAYFKVSTDSISLIFVMYLVFVSGGLLIAGRIEDKIGLKNAFIVGFSAFASGSILATVSPTELVLIIARSIQGIGGAFLISATFATVSQYFNKTTAIAVFGFVAIATEMGTSIGSPAGGLLTQWVSWKGVFVMDSLLGIFGLLAVYLARSDFNQKKFKKDPKPMDLPGCLLWFLTVGLLIFALNKGHSFGWTSHTFLTLIIASIAFGILFYIRETRYKYPVFPFRLLGGQKGISALFIGFLAFSLIAGNSFLLPFYLEHIKKISPSEVGLLFLVYSGTAALISFNASKLAKLANQRTLITIALGFITLAFVSMVFTINSKGIWHVFLFLIIMGMGFGIFFPNNNSLVMSSAPPGEKGVFSGLFNTFNNVGGALGACLFEVVYAWQTSHTGQLTTDKAMDNAWMLPGFKDAYLLAAMIAVIALVISLLLVKKNRT